jgi:folylpolyglutamate synthase/dihydropteroate synthase
MLSALRADEFDLVICCPAPSPRGLPVDDLLGAAERIGCDEVRSAASVESAIDLALRDAGPDDAILITGSLYVVGAARTHVGRSLP